MEALDKLAEAECIAEEILVERQEVSMASKDLTSLFAFSSP
jgi:hypothetical protein